MHRIIKRQPIFPSGGRATFDYPCRFQIGVGVGVSKISGVGMPENFPPAFGIRVHPSRAVFKDLFLPCAVLGATRHNNRFKGA